MSLALFRGISPEVDKRVGVFSFSILSIYATTIKVRVQIILVHINTKCKNSQANLPWRLGFVVVSRGEIYLESALNLHQNRALTFNRKVVNNQASAMLALKMKIPCAPAC